MAVLVGRSRGGSSSVSTSSCGTSGSNNVSCSSGSISGSSSRTNTRTEQHVILMLHLYQLRSARRDPRNARRELLAQSRPRRITLFRGVLCSTALFRRVLCRATSE